MHMTLLLIFLTAAGLLLAGNLALNSKRHQQRSRIAFRRSRAALLVGGLAAMSIVAAPTVPALAAQQAQQVDTSRGAVVGTVAPSPQGASSTQAREYAAREASAKELEKFVGGETSIVIGGSALVVILLIVLIIVLI